MSGPSDVENPSEHPLESQLILSCARTVVGDQTAGEIEALLRRQLDWIYVLKAANRHRIVPMFLRALTAASLRAVPDWAFRHLEKWSADIAARNASQLEVLVDLLEVFRRQGVPAIPFKGPILASQVYRSLSLRQFDDLDILVRPYDYFLTIGDILRSRGWKLARDDYWQRGFLNEPRGASLDLHRRLTDGSVPFRCTFDDLWKDRAALPLCGSSVQCLSPVDTFLVACLQIAKDAAPDHLPLAKICDVAKIIGGHGDFDWQRAFARAARLGVLNICHVGALVAADLLGVQCPSEHMREARHLKSLAVHVRECVFPRADRRYSRPELLERATFCREIRERWRDRTNQMYFDFLRANQADYEAVRLPRALELLYYAGRPVRLAGRYGRRALTRIARVTRHGRPVGEA
jgi:hypothetical protein